MSFRQIVKDKRVLVFGLGLQGGGVGDALWLYENSAQVRVTDLKSQSQLERSLASLPSEISRTLGQHLDDDITWADIIIKNPGVPDSQPQLALARQLGKPIYTSIALVCKEAADKTIGVTGTRGKTTTTELVYSLLSQQFPGKVVKGGNLAGTSALTLMDSLDTAKYLVLELSSFQLAGFHELKVSPRYAILTNIYPDHLNRYPDMASYTHDKTAVFSYQNPNSFVLVNRDNQAVTNLVGTPQGKLIYYSAADLPAQAGLPQDWQLKLEGQHNRENAAAAKALADLLKIPPAVTRSVVTNFEPIPYRLQLIRELGGVKYYNDTTSTTPTATLVAIQTMQAPTILIVGGDDKKLPHGELVSEIAGNPRIESVILLGSKNIPAFVKELKAACPHKIQSQVFSMSEAVAAAAQLAKPNQNVLLSPGFFSFDLFENEFDRGRQFNAAVKSL